MLKLRRTLPSTHALMVFEASARHLSFTRAAEEFGISQSAISRQIGALEQHLGIALFRRLHRALRLTAEGERLHSAVAMGLGHIAETASTLAKPATPAEVTVWTGQAFAAFWLMPRLGNFNVAHPRIDLRLLAADKTLDPRAENIDVAVRVGDGDWPGLSALKLFDEEIFPVCSPAYLAGRPALREPADLLGETLLHQEVIGPTWLTWEEWLADKGLNVPGKMRGPCFNSHVIAMQAAQSGQGIALGWHRLIAGMLKAGSLIRPLDATFHATYAYYLLLPKGREPSEQAIAFRDWVVAEAAHAD